MDEWKVKRNMPHADITVNGPADPFRDLRLKTVEIRCFQKDKYSGKQEKNDNQYECNNDLKDAHSVH